MKVYDALIWPFMAVVGIFAAAQWGPSLIKSQFPELQEPTQYAVQDSAQRAPKPQSWLKQVQTPELQKAWDEMERYQSDQIRQYFENLDRTHSFPHQQPKLGPSPPY